MDILSEAASHLSQSAWRTGEVCGRSRPDGSARPPPLATWCSSPSGTGLTLLGSTDNHHVRPGGDIIAERCAQRVDLPSCWRNIAERIAAALPELLLQVISVKPGRRIELNDVTRQRIVR
jgi:hypothetical protein